VNHPQVSELAGRLRPDIIAVFGTGLIRGPLLSAGRLGVINLHGGLSPRYRGSDCTFWALYNREFDQIGCTLHFIDPGIDTGDLIAHISPEVTESDDESKLFWRAVRDSAAVYAECLERLECGEALGQKQREKGNLYLFKSRTRRHERELEAKMRDGLLKGVQLPARIRWFERTADLSALHPLARSRQERIADALAAPKAAPVDPSAPDAARRCATRHAGRSIAGSTPPETG
jgi:methionyl-tRNA formyltransferase